MIQSRIQSGIEGAIRGLPPGFPLNTRKLTRLQGAEWRFEGEGNDRGCVPPSDGSEDRPDCGGLR